MQRQQTLFPSSSGEGALPQAEDVCVPAGPAGVVRILMVEHDANDAELCLRAIQRDKLEVQAEVVTTREELERCLRSARYDVILSDFRLPGWTGLEALDLARSLGCEAPVILVTGTLGEVMAVECIKRGICDYILKNQLTRLPVAVRRALEEQSLRREREQAEQARQESEEHFRSAFDNAPIGMMLRSPQEEIREVNRAFCEMLGYTERELLSRDIASITHAEDVAKSQEATGRLLRGEAGSVKFEKRYLKKNGGSVLARACVSLVRDATGQPLHFVAHVEDITAQRRMETQLAAVQKFEAIGQLAGGIAHDFNNMVGAILGWAELGLEESPGESRLRRYFSKIRQQAERAATLTRQLLAFARRQLLESRNLDLNVAITETLSLLEKLIGSDIEVDTVLASNLCMTRADPSQIEQVVMNLCINARDAMPNGGRLSITTRNIELAEEQCHHIPYSRPGQFVEMVVCDTGVGMDAATLERIFEPFFTTKGPGKGTGLGLATVYGIVKQHGGFINASSEPGRGTTFQVCFPASLGATERTEAPAAVMPVRGGQETILIADDHEGMREVARETLEGLGYHVILASDGEQAVRTFESGNGNADLVLLDVVLPKLSGPQVYQRITERSPRVPVIFATGYSSETTGVAELRAKGMPVLHKPYTSTELARKVREMLDRRRAGN